MQSGLRKNALVKHQESKHSNQTPSFRAKVLKAGIRFNTDRFVLEALHIRNANDDQSIELLNQKGEWGHGGIVRLRADQLQWGSLNWFYNTSNMLYIDTYAIFNASQFYTLNFSTLKEKLKVHTYVKFSQTLGLSIACERTALGRYTFQHQDWKKKVCFEKLKLHMPTTWTFSRYSWPLKQQKLNLWFFKIDPFCCLLIFRG